MPPKLSALSREACKIVYAHVEHDLRRRRSGRHAPVDATGLSVYNAVIHGVVRVDVPVKQLAVEFLGGSCVLDLNFKVDHWIGHS